MIYFFKFFAFILLANFAYCNLNITIVANQSDIDQSLSEKVIKNHLNNSLVKHCTQNDTLNDYETFYTDWFLVNVYEELSIVCKSCNNFIDIKTPNFESSQINKKIFFI